MSHVIVERRTLFWPGRNVTSALALAVPGLTALGRLSFAPVDKASVWDGGGTFETLRAANEVTALGAARVDFPQDTIAIGIAPDSIIHSCDIALGGNMGEIERHRLSPGSPMIGCVGHTHGLVTLHRSIPFYSAPANTPVSLDSNATRSPGNFGTWPLRLEVFRACAVPPQRSDVRAPMASTTLHDVLLGETHELISCVDGRVRVDVEVINIDTSTDDVAVTIFELLPLVDPALSGSSDAAFAVQLPLDEAGTLSQTLSPNEGDVFSFYGNPMSLLKVIINGGVAGNAQVQVRINGWDR